LVVPDAVEVIERLVPYIDRELKRHVRLHSITRHLAGLFAGRPGARAWRRSLGELQARPEADARTLLQLARDVSRVCLPADG
jgi:tRNA-dihydrouridine synthase A